MPVRRCGARSARLRDERDHAPSAARRPRRVRVLEPRGQGGRADVSGRARGRAGLLPGGRSQSRLARSRVADLLLELAQGTPIKDALARTLNDPTLDIAYWLPETGRYVSADGKPLQEGDGSRHVTLVEHAGRPTAALLHDPMLVDEPELIEATAAAAGLWLDNERLQAERAQIEFLETIVNASPSLLCSLDREGRIVNLNHASRVASGYLDEEEVRWLPFWDVFVAPEERGEPRTLFEEAAPFHREAGFEHTFVNRAGQVLTIAWSTAPSTTSRGTCATWSAAGTT